jgi:hypothetical protein
MDEVERLLRGSYRAFLASDRATLAKMFSDDYTFTSPRDNHISKAQFFEHCLPGSKLFKIFTIDRVFVEDHDENVGNTMPFYWLGIVAQVRTLIMTQAVLLG